MPDVLVLTLLILLAAYLWHGALKARERARALGAELCARAQLQLLDQTVALERLTLVRDGDGRRRHRFELSSDGRDRRHGSLDLVGERLVGHDLPPAAPPPRAAVESNVIPLHEAPRGMRPH